MISKSNTTIILSLVAIFIIISPGLVISEIDQNTESHVLEIQGNYVDGTDILIADNVNSSVINRTYFCYGVDSYLGNDVNPDTVFWGRKTSNYHKDGVYAGNYITYSGNGTYTMVPDYDDVNNTVYTKTRFFMVELNITNSEWANFDFVKLESNFNGSFYYHYRESGGYVFNYHNIKTSANEYIWINSLTDKSSLSQMPNETLYLVIGNVFTDDSDNDLTSFTFRLQGYNYEPGDSMAWDDETLYFMTIIAFDIIMVVVFLFTTNFIDIKYDSSKGKWRR